MAKKATGKKPRRSKRQNVPRAHIALKVLGHLSWSLSSRIVQERFFDIAPGPRTKEHRLDRRLFEKLGRGIFLILNNIDTPDKIRSDLLAMLSLELADRGYKQASEQDAYHAILRKALNAEVEMGDYKAFLDLLKAEPERAVREFEEMSPPDFLKRFSTLDRDHYLIDQVGFLRGLFYEKLKRATAVKEQFGLASESVEKGDIEPAIKVIASYMTMHPSIPYAPGTWKKGSEHSSRNDRLLLSYILALSEGSPA